MHIEAIAGLEFSITIFWKSVREEDEEEKRLVIAKCFSYQVNLII